MQELWYGGLIWRLVFRFYTQTDLVKKFHLCGQKFIIGGPNPQHSSIVCINLLSCLSGKRIGENLVCLQPDSNPRADKKGSGNGGDHRPFVPMGLRLEVPAYSLQYTVEML